MADSETKDSSGAGGVKLPVFDTLLLSLDGTVLNLALNRPDKANAMNAPLWRELQAAFDWADAEPRVRVVVLSGNGRHFCAGLDLSMFSDQAVMASGSGDAGRAGEQVRRNILRLQDNLTAIERCRKPVLAAIHYTCIGGGVDMACCCDMRYCTEDAYFSIKEIDLGMVADVGTLQRLPRLIGDGLVRELAYTGRRFDAHEALSAGFVNRVYADREAMMEGVMAVAREIAGKSPLAVRGSKEMLLYARDHSVADGLNYIATWNAGLTSQQDLMNSVRAGGEGVEYED
jgi:enoyl-CoA hydratase